MKPCPYCKEQVQDDAIYCPHCTHHVKVGESELRLARDWWKYVLIGFMIAIVIIYLGTH
jgi:uncharacterized membrane protein YvbJ